MLGGTIANVVHAGITTPFSRTETFRGGSRDSNASPGMAAFISLITVFIILLLILFFGQYLWNNILVVLVPAVKPAKSVWQILGLAILISLLMPGSCTCM